MGGLEGPSRVGALADLAESRRQRSAKSARRGRCEVGDQTGTGLPLLLQGQLHPEVIAFVAVIEGGHSPGELGPLGIVGRVVIEAIVGELLHVPSQPSG
jgi:hypothetical protein